MNRNLTVVPFPIRIYPSKIFNECLHKISPVEFFQIITATSNTVLNCERQLQRNHQLKQENEVEKSGKRRGSHVPTFAAFFIPTTKSRTIGVCLCTVLPSEGDFIAVFVGTYLPDRGSFVAEFGRF